MCFSTAGGSRSQNLLSYMCHPCHGCHVLNVGDVLRGIVPFVSLEMGNKP